MKLGNSLVNLNELCYLELNLASNDINNEIEIELSNLTSLNNLSLYFHQNNISRIRFGLNNLSSLENLTLYLGENEIGDLSGVEIGKALNNLTELTWLDL